MNYKKIHDSIILIARSRGIISGYTEAHHVIPKSMGGGNGKDNLVHLSAKEHYIVHWLLFKIHRNKSMAFAWYRMTHGKDSVFRYKSSSFEYARRAKANATSELFSGKKLSAELKAKLSAAKLGKTYKDLGREKSPLAGRKCSVEHVEKMRASNVGRKHSDATKAILSEKRKGALNPIFGKKTSDETKRKISDALKLVRQTPMSTETRKKLSDSMRARRSAQRKEKGAIHAAC